MKQAEIESSIGKAVIVNGFRDIGIDPNIRRIIGKEGTLIKRCKSGLLQIECEGKLFALPPINVDLKTT
jgi:hypothetical protein